jgi:Putative redox-active protein (C_GCAxxG_C_C).
LEYFDQGKELTCSQCGKHEIANISCSNGHYICDECHGKGVLDLVKDYITSCKSKDPLEIAETLMGNKEQVPMLGCENAWIAAGALITAIRNEGSISLTNEQILEVLNRTARQAVGGYCGLTGVCGIAIAIGACFSVILGAACPKDQETATTMKVVAAIVNTIAEETGPCCCKNFVRKSLIKAAKLVEVHLSVSLPIVSVPQSCQHIERHPHGCRKEKCSYFG